MVDFPIRTWLHACMSDSQHCKIYDDLQQGFTICFSQNDDKMRLTIYDTDDIAGDQPYYVEGGSQIQLRINLMIKMLEHPSPHRCKHIQYILNDLKGIPKN